MSSGLILLLVAIVLIVIVAYLAGVIIRKRNESLISTLDERKLYLICQFKTKLTRYKSSIS